VILCCNIINVDAGGHVVEHKDISSVVPGYKKYNLSVHAVAGISNITTADQLSLVIKGIPNLVNWATAAGVDGLVVDYEPKDHYTYTESHAANYAEFLSRLTAAMQGGQDG
jgi:hypothetical protein